MTLLELMEATDAAEEATTPVQPPTTQPATDNEHYRGCYEAQGGAVYESVVQHLDRAPDSFEEFMVIVAKLWDDPSFDPAPATTPGDTDDTDPEPDDNDGSSDGHKAARRADWNARQAARVARYENRAANAHRASDEAYKRSGAAVAGIPMGQPILVGHHSEGRHRSALKKSDNAMRQSCAEQKKAEYWEGRAKSAASNNAIMSDDPDAQEKLEDEIARLEARQQLMTAANKCARKMDRAGLVDLGFNERQVNELLSEPAYSFEKRGFQSYQLSNNSANIRRLKQRLAAVKATETATTTETEAAPGVRIVDNVEDNRLQIFFPGKPSDDVRKFLKGRGFRWSPNAGAWQRHRSNAARYDAAEAVKLYAAE